MCLDVENTKHFQENEMKKSENLKNANMTVFLVQKAGNWKTPFSIISFL